MSELKCRGFTLVELMVVMAILGIIAALMTPNIMNDINQRRANLTIEETQLVMDAARSYRIQNGVWPGDSTCSNAISIMKGSSPAYIGGGLITNKYNSRFSTSCTSRTFSLDQNAIADWDGYVANSLAGTEIVSAATHQIRTTVGIPGSEAALDSKLSRIATGNAELNRMRTTLLLGGNDITEVGNLNATSGSFAGNVTAQMLTVQQQASINGALAVQGESQFVGKARFNDELILEKVVVENQRGCESGALARDASGKPLSCQSGVWLGVERVLTQAGSGQTSECATWADSAQKICQSLPYIYIKFATAFSEPPKILISLAAPFPFTTCSQNQLDWFGHEVHEISNTGFRLYGGTSPMGCGAANNGVAVSNFDWIAIGIK